MKTKLHLFVIVLALLAGVHTVAAQGTAFTYQGQLTTGSGPANGYYDVTFKLWNASSGGAQVGSTQTFPATVISNGLFTATINFGSQFNGTSYWLELAVRTNGVGSYQTLTPRQALTPTPYAITAENVDGAIPASQLTGTIPSIDLIGANGSGLVGLNASQLTTGIVPYAALPPDVAYTDVSQTFTGNNGFSGNILMLNPLSTIVFPATSGANAPMMEMFSSGTGNADRMVIAHSSAYPTYGLQYQDASDKFNFLSAGTPVLTINLGAQSIYTIGNVGIGTTSAAQQFLSVHGGLNVDQIDLNAGFINNGNNNGYGITFGSASGEGIASQRTAGVDQFSLEFYTAFINRMIIMNNGYVGIGTTNPAAQLEVDNADTSTTTTGVRGVSGGGNAGELHNGGFYSAAGEFVGANGVIGVGTTNQDFSYGVIGIASANGRAVYGDYADTAGGSGYAVYANSSSANGTGVYTASAGTGSALTIGSGAIHVSGASTNSTTTAAFTQVATASNIGADWTKINNQLCNGDPNAILIITPNWNPHGGPANYWTHVVGVYYNGSNWAIFNEDGTAMPAGPAFNVLIIKN